MSRSLYSLDSLTFPIRPFEWRQLSAVRPDCNHRNETIIKSFQFKTLITLHQQGGSSCVTIDTL